MKLFDRFKALFFTVKKEEEKEIVWSIMRGYFNKRNIIFEKGNRLAKYPYNYTVYTEIIEEGTLMLLHYEYFYLSHIRFKRYGKYYLVKFTKLHSSVNKITPLEINYFNIEVDIEVEKIKALFSHESSAAFLDPDQRHEGQAFEEYNQFPKTIRYKYYE